MTKGDRDREWELCHASSLRGAVGVSAMTCFQWKYELLISQHNGYSCKRKCSTFRIYAIWGSELWFLDIWGEIQDLCSWDLIPNFWLDLTFRICYPEGLFLNTLQVIQGEKITALAMSLNRVPMVGSLNSWWQKTVILNCFILSLIVMKSLKIKTSI